VRAGPSGERHPRKRRRTHDRPARSAHARS
jgi:hypothetical protein